jgi:hypothetical protein
MRVGEMGEKQTHGNWLRKGGDPGQVFRNKPFQNAAHESDGILRK